MTNLRQYTSAPWFVSILSNVPIEHLEEVRKRFRTHAIRIRVKYRGPRNTPFDYGRGLMARQGTCLKRNAKTFSVYID